MCPLQEIKRRKKNFINFLFVLQHTFPSYVKRLLSLSPLADFKAFPIHHSLSLSLSLILTRVTSRKEEVSSHSLVSPYQHSPHSIDPRIKRARLEKGDGIISVGVVDCGDCGGQVHGFVARQVYFDDRVLDEFLTLIQIECRDMSKRDGVVT